LKQQRANKVRPDVSVSPFFPPWCPSGEAYFVDNCVVHTSPIKCGLGSTAQKEPKPAFAALATGNNRAKMPLEAPATGENWSKSSKKAPADVRRRVKNAVNI
jgi:hypothetical protein